jgi:hypothetical protein
VIDWGRTGGIVGRRGRGCNTQLENGYETKYAICNAPASALASACPDKNPLSGYLQRAQCAPGRYKTDKPVAKDVIKPKNGLRLKNRGRGAAAEPTKSMDLRTRMTNYFTGFCVESSIYFYFEAPGAKQTSSNAPAAPGIRSPAAAAGRFNRNPRSGRRTCHRDLLLRRSGCSVFFLRQAAAAKEQENRPLKKNPKKTFYIALVRTKEHLREKKKSDAPAYLPTYFCFRFYFTDIIWGVFELSSCRETTKNAKKRKAPPSPHHQLFCKRPLTRTSPRFVTWCF